MSDQTIFALTSFSPSSRRVSLTRECVQSWRNAALEVRAFNHPSEIAGLAKMYEVDFVPVAETTYGTFGRHFIPINAFVDWAIRQNAPVLLINSDIYLHLADWEIKRLRWLADGGLCYLVRYNHNGNTRYATREPYGIDAFLFHGRDAVHLPGTFLSMGQPFWDYWIPHEFTSRGLAIYAVEYPAALHHSHRPQWSWENWHRCALEFDRISGLLESDRSFEACVAMSAGVRNKFARKTISVPKEPFQIKTWIQQTFRYPGPKTFLELGSHQGFDTAWMAEIPGVNIYAFEPDPRNQQAPRPNVSLQRAAVAERDGTGTLILSHQGWGREWTYSSSIKQPKNHLRRYPVTFQGTVEVKLITLDTFCREHGLGIIDLIWADIQGAEGEMVRGGQQALSRTRYLYTEYSDDELYENQATLMEILDLLPDFRVVELWPDDVLLANRKFVPGT